MTGSTIDGTMFGRGYISQDVRLKLLFAEVVSVQASLADWLRRGLVKLKGTLPGVA